MSPSAIRRDLLLVWVSCFCVVLSPLVADADSDSGVCEDDQCSSMLDHGSIPTQYLLEAAQTADVNILTAKSGSHLPAVNRAENGDVNISVPHGKKDGNDHWVQWIFVGACSGGKLDSIVFTEYILYADSDKPSVTLSSAEIQRLQEGVDDKELYAFAYCTKDGFWKLGDTPLALAINDDSDSTVCSEGDRSPSCMLGHGPVAENWLLSSVQGADVNILTAKSGSHLPMVDKAENGDVTISVPHGKKDDNDHWVQWIFVIACTGDKLDRIVFSEYIKYADSDKPSATLSGTEIQRLQKAPGSAGKELYAFAYCTRDGFWKLSDAPLGSTDMVGMGPIGEEELFAVATVAQVNVLTAKSGSHLPLMEKLKNGDVTISVPHGKKPTEDHWVQWIFLGELEGDKITNIVFKKEVAYEESDKPSVTISHTNLTSMKYRSTNPIYAFEYCAKDGFWHLPQAL